MTTPNREYLTPAERWTTGERRLAHRFVTTNANNLRYNVTHDTWHYLDDDGHWHPDWGTHVHQLLDATLQDAAKLATNNHWRKLAADIHACQTHQAAEGILNIARHIDPMPITTHDPKE